VKPIIYFHLELILRISGTVSPFLICLNDVHVGIFFPPVAQQPLLGQGLLVIKASRSHSDSPHSVGLLWTSDQPVL
jgi:hypothetical protein